MQKERQTEQQRAPTRIKRHHMNEQGFKHKTRQSYIDHHNGDTTSKTIVDEPLVDSADIKTLSPFSSTLRSILHRNRAEIGRIAHEMDVAENTIYRWMNGTSVPRNSYLRALPDVMLEHRQAIIQATNKTFPGILDMAILASVPEIRIEIYRRVHELIATTADPANCLWQVAQTIFDYAILHLDIEHTGISTAYASLMPPCEEDDHIHSLYETMTRGTSPWPAMSETRIFLGSTTLAGAVVTQQRMMRWDSLDEAGRMLVEVDEHEASSCAAPVMRGGRVAGVFVVSSTQSHFFDNPTTCRAIADLAHLLATSLQDKDFYPYTKLKLRPMLNLAQQREILAACYVPRLLAYARENRVSRAEAEIHVRRDLEGQFEQH
ncbi:GAF domain-containing protein [Ktedonospora formicarum]|uniref:GAF domain-containing protein n=1 Tax=Ktedonospora formicarum TaxID=2778364 RepID=A0A8J3MRJ3_9CHLR|nr:GAF domain-containing protein [Ktedonospora formicarum]GHO43841.1 hypothetical protein KSX_20040 [Ktedonospora formicarum]